DQSPALHASDQIDSRGLQISGVIEGTRILEAPGQPDSGRELEKLSRTQGQVRRILRERHRHPGDDRSAHTLLKRRITGKGDPAQPDDQRATTLRKTLDVEETTLKADRRGARLYAVRFPDRHETWGWVAAEMSRGRRRPEQQRNESPWQEV